MKWLALAIGIGVALGATGFTWDSDADVPAGSRSATASLRVTAIAMGVTPQSATRSGINLPGSGPNIVVNLQPSSTVDPVGCPFDVSGVAAVDLTFEASTDGGVSWFPASAHAGSSL